jgi:hypothetical protein
MQLILPRLVVVVVLHLHLASTFSFIFALPHANVTTKGKWKLTVVYRDKVTGSAHNNCHHHVIVLMNWDDREGSQAYVPSNCIN